LENYQAVRLLQAGLSLVTVLLVYGIAAAVCSRRAGLWAAALCCFYPSLLGYNNLLLTEVLFTLLLCSFCAVVVRGLLHNSLTALGAAGVLLGLAALTRSVVWLFPPVLALFLLVAFPGGWRRRLLAAALPVLTFAAVLAPWSVRNTRMQQTFIAVDVMGGRNFMTGNYRYTPLYRSWAAIGLGGERSWFAELAAEHPRPERDTQGKLDKLALRHGLRFVAANPVLTLQRDVVKFFDFWGLERELVSGAREGYFGPVPHALLVPLAVVVCGAYVAVLFAGLFGMFLAPPADRRVHLFMLLLIAFVCGMHTLVFGHSRYHLPLMPLVMVYAAALLARGKGVARPRRAAVWAAGAACVLLAGGWVWEAVVVDRERILDLVRALFQGAA
jgi:4-amino-4-deoxy-L-arabinose transferase-like glycosyltransferase